MDSLLLQINVRRDSAADSLPNFLKLLSSLSLDLIPFVYLAHRIPSF
jgi:hypothetical protein